jgi:hypothetical protein
MSGVKADWRLADLLDEGDDPFAEIIYSSGLSVNLNGSDEELQKALVDTIHREGRLWEKGITCPLKDAGQDCLSCSVAVMDPAEQLSRLCRIGKDQRTILQVGERRRDALTAPLRELAASVEPFVEMGDLDPAYAELRTAVGL